MLLNVHNGKCGERPRVPVAAGNQNADATADGQTDDGGHGGGKTAAGLSLQNVAALSQHCGGGSAFYFPLNVTILCERASWRRPHCGGDKGSNQGRGECERVNALSPPA